MAEFTATPNGEGRRFAVVASRFNETITTRLAEGAVDALVRHGARFEDVDVVWVPGAWELPAACRQLLQSERYDALVVVGAVIRGETPHFDFVAGEASRGVAQASADFDVPIGFGLLTTDDMAQAEARAGGAHGNKGWDAAMAALEMVALFEMLSAAAAHEDDEDDDAYDEGEADEGLVQLRRIGRPGDDR